MAGPIYTPFSSRKRAMAINTQTAPGSAIALSSSDVIDVASCNWTPRSRTASDDRYTGSIHRPGPIYLGVEYDVTFEWYIHGFAGAIPALGAFLPGRVMTSWSFTEQRLATAVGPEALSAGSATGATLGATALGTANYYKGMAINLASIGASPTGLAMIQNYTAGKVATFARSRAVPTGNYTIPAQLAYTLSPSEPANPSSITIWDGDNAGSGHRLNFVDMRPSAGTIELMTAGPGGGNNFCKLTGTYSGTLLSEANEAAPTISSQIAVPPFLNAQQDIANLQIGGSSATIDMGFSQARPPNPNQLDGGDPGLMTGTNRKVSYTLNRVGRPVIDFNALTAAGTQVPSQFLWGLNPAGNYMGLLIDAQRFDIRSRSENGDFDQTTGDAWIDGIDRAISLTFLA